MYLSDRAAISSETRAEARRAYRFPEDRASRHARGPKVFENF